MARQIFRTIYRRQSRGETQNNKMRRDANESRGANATILLARYSPRSSRSLANQAYPVIKRLATQPVTSVRDASWKPAPKIYTFTWTQFKRLPIHLHLISAISHLYSHYRRSGFVLSIVLSGGPLMDDVYKLEQYHCHWGCSDSRGSEHTVDGQAFAGEVE